jgi:putative IMPACT (imprinted ancient) family translation regulator
LGWPPLERCFDAGEPRGTAGPPILRVLQGAALSDGLIAVVRWFGGTKLGKGGLARAYAEAAKLALAQASLVDRVPVVRLRLELPYQRLGAVQRLVAPPGVQLVSCTYGATVSVELLVASDRVAATLATLADLGLVAVSVGASTASARR